MKYYIIAGEASGDLHGSNLVKGLLEKDPSAQIRAWGGELMRQAGAEVVKDYRENSIMGFVEVVANIGKILGNMKECCKDILAFNPDVVILIDYPGFNMKIAKFAKKHGLKVFYYIAPKVWAWKERRVHKIKRYVDKLFIIFPFEVEYFRKWGIETVYRGNPLLDSVCNFS
ncbi:lipid-A-disaccharide synthase, partial [bacterium]|nr:lipid-A-disaccharide synthase [bacterium]